MSRWTYVKTAYQEQPEKAPLHSSRGDRLPSPPKHVLLKRSEIGERLRSLREQKRLTQVELAKLLGTHQANVSQIERGLRGVSVQQIVKLARALHISPDGLLGVRKVNGGEEPVRNQRLMRRVRKIERLPSDRQDAIIRMIDAFLDSHAPSR
jgi:transcriptional regulator with XRE-family HTH domain